jgi:deazaflavin-dependent oxidoreductase (nitroreductase family)
MTTPSALSPADGDHPFNRRVIAAFRAGGGRVGGQFAGSSLLLLTTRGAVTGLPRTTPLVYLPDGDRLVVFASNGGAPRPPSWFRNLRADPAVVVEAGTERFDAVARVLDPAEHEELWRRQIAREPDFAAFRSRALDAGHIVNVVALERRRPTAPGVPS